MTRFTSGICLGMILALASVAEAKTASIDFTGASPVSQGLTQVNNAQTKDGTTVIAPRGGKNVAMTGNSDSNHYLYLAIDPAFKPGLKSVWLTVEYFEEGTDGFQVQYDANADAHATADPTTRTKFNQKGFTRQTWHLTDFKLAGGEEGGADLRIDDTMDGPELIASVSVSDEDPDFVHLPYAVNKITIDGKVDPAEGWDKAYTVKLDRPELIVGGADMWSGPKDFSGTYSFQWDENALYLLGQVVDATPRLNDQGSYGPPAYWSGDGMEQYIGLDDSDPEVTDGMVADTDFKVTISLGDIPKWATEDRGVFKDGNPTTDLGDIKDNIAIVNTDNPKGYVFEMRIPWNIHKNTPPKAGQRIRWAMFANNSKEIPSNQDVAISSTGRDDFNHKPAEWNRAMLDPKP